MATEQLLTTQDQRGFGGGLLAAVLVMVVVAFGLRWGSEITETDMTWDERYITQPIYALINGGWTVENAIDFQETKGPAMIWPYAAWGTLAGDSLNSLRMFTVLCFILTVIPLMGMAARCGRPPPTWPLVAIGLVLLPYEAVLSQLVMGEPSYILITAAMLLAVLWGAGDRTRQPHPVAGPVLYALLLFVVLHSRIHVVPFAAGVCFAMTLRDGRRSWPWWVASIVAGLLRIPLWVRWGGVVSSDYQVLHGFGFRLESMTYLAAACALPLGIFLLTWIWQFRRQTWWFLAPVGVVLGAGLGVVAPPDLIDPQVWDYPWGQVKVDSFFLGPARTLVLATKLSESAHWIPLTMMAAVGLGGLGALTSAALAIRPNQPLAILACIQAVTLGCALLVYLFVSAFVFDRFLLAWTVPLPVLWLALLPRWAWIVQMVVLFGFMVLHVSALW